MQLTNKMSDIQAEGQLSKFREWICQRQKSDDPDTFPNYMRVAWDADDPKVLNQLIWQEWWEFNQPNGAAARLPYGGIERSYYCGPRGGIYYINSSGGCTYV